ncbi:Sulfate-transporting ATPase [Tepidanaerobacter acetatoxydans Re1]|uniref:Sulfate-transporting ATPase n=1 Tax=Tepidanaerobacter acetatoxydans (strain DSM 21804 / JCM 16047 / Re1) TaxID=1209989 RepID=F4LXE4_TEPAE|nr:ABC transporter ATP-binding protein [Tepidanaerobacter acetatoxydans]AEE91046.1 Sulfate-transporting ATPase [Tepidanaerobacter acetatoxydans Re1]CCP25661.1 Sulfate-transporting ATPase [Tepidanaerobacter acetatoxydans Re1]
MIAIQTINLTKKYKGKIAVNSLNLTIEQGELFAWLGLNGAGKTTTIKMLSCLTKPTNGDAIILGNSIISNPIKVKELINVSPQETAIAPNLTVRENLEFIAGIYGSDKRQSKQKAEDIISSFELSSITEEKAKTLSGGWQRRLSIAMALISEPQILFLDEPTLGLDVVARRELWSVIKRLKNKVTIILTTHYLEEAESLADRISIMAKGELKSIGTPNELISKTNTARFEDAFIALAGEGGIRI